jgi:hypothetical protein
MSSEREKALRDCTAEAGNCANTRGVTAKSKSTAPV